MSERSIFARGGVAALFSRPNLSICTSLVFYLGVPVVAVTWYVFYQTQPEYFDNSLPTISRSGSFAPASYVFSVGMVLVSLCTFVTWTTVWLAHRKWIAALVRDRAQLVMANSLNNGTVAVGLLAGFSLGAMGVVSLETHNATHVFFSYVFFAYQVFTFLLDTMLSLKLRRLSLAAGGSTEVYDLNGRHWVFLIVSAAATVFLIMFYAKDHGIFADRMVAQRIYVTSEYVVSFFSFYYASRFYPLVRKYLESID
jgi:hypothetical protein